YDIGESRRLWSGPDPGAYRKESDTVVPDYAILTGAGFSDVWTYQLSTGDKLRCAGSNYVVAAGDGWLVTGLSHLQDGDKPTLRYFAL
ncbi:MAG: hypothetical protein ACRDT6_27890, partial [Micromonosporaceae bacterium]